MNLFVANNSKPNLADKCAARHYRRGIFVYFRFPRTPFAFFRFSLAILIVWVFTTQITYGKIPLSESDIADTINCYRSDKPSDPVKAFQSRMPAVITDMKIRDDVIQKLSAVVQKLKIEDAGVTEEFNKVVAPVLKLYGREKAYDIIIFQHKTPILFSDTGVVLVISTGMIARAESDDELIGYVAHEVAHEYFASYSIFSKHLLKLVVESGEEEVIDRKLSQTLAIVELQCDAFSAATLAHLGFNPLSFIKGMEDIGRDFPAYDMGFHPSDSIRRRTVKQLVPQKYLQSTPKISEQLKELKRLIQMQGDAENKANRSANINP